MYAEQWRVVKQLAARRYNGNISAALRQIIMEWAQVCQPLPTPTAEK